jgi:CRP-like cAMP-binding protein
MVDLDTLHLPEVTFRDGMEIFVEGQRHHQLLILVSGAVRITAKGTEISVIDEPGSILGEMAILLGTPATATATTVGKSRFLRSVDPKGLMRDQPGIALEIAETLARRLDLVTRYLADLRNQYADREDHLRVVDEVLASLLEHREPGTRPNIEPGSEREAEAPY